MYSLHSRRWRWTALTVTDIITVNCAQNSLWDPCHKKNDSLITTGFSVRSVSSPSSWWCFRWGMPPGILPLPPRRGRALPPILIVGFILRFLEAMQSRQRFLEVRWMPYRHRIGIHQIRTDPPITTIYINFFFCGNMTVVFACKSVHFKNDFFSAAQLDHRLSQPRVTEKSIMKVFVLFLSTPLLKLFRRVKFFATFFLPISMTVWPALPDVEVRDREEIQHGRDILLVFCCVISQEVSTRAVDDAKVPIRHACSALWFRLHVDYLA